MVNGVAIGLGLLVAGMVTVFVTWPWWAPRVGLGLRFERVEGPNPDAQVKALTISYGNILAATRDLDFDHAVGKVNHEDYASLRSALLVGAAEVVAQLDERPVIETEIDEPNKVELVVIGQPAGAADCPYGLATSSESSTACVSCGWMSHAGSVYCTNCGRKLDRLCPGCGQTIDASDRFCAGCGSNLALAFS